RSLTLSGSSAKSAYGSHLHWWRCLMATLVRLRKLTTQERAELERLARSRTEEARLVVRAKVVGPQGPAARDVAADRGGSRAGDSVLERPSPPIRVWGRRRRHRPRRSPGVAVVPSVR